MSTKASPRTAYVLLFTLAAVWGSSFLFIKLAVATIPPFTLVAGRVVLAAAALLVWLWLTGQRLPREPALWVHFAVLALVGNLVPFVLISWGEIFIDSGLTAILMAVMPLATIALAHVFTHDDRLTPAKTAGMVVGFIGIVILVGPGVLAGLGQEVVAQLAVAGAAVCYAVSSVYARVTRLVALAPAVTGSGVLLCAALVVLPLSLAIDQPWRLQPSSDSLLALLVLALLCTAAAYLILFRLIATSGVTFVALINYLAPVFGVVWGVLLLRETLDPGALAGLALILGGVGLSRIGAAPRELSRTDAGS